MSAQKRNPASALNSITPNEHRLESRKGLRIVGFNVKKQDMKNAENNIIFLFGGCLNLILVKWVWMKA